MKQKTKEQQIRGKNNFPRAKSSVNYPNANSSLVSAHNFIRTPINSLIMISTDQRIVNKFYSIANHFKTVAKFAKRIERRSGKKDVEIQPKVD